MRRTDPVVLASALREPVVRLGGGFMISREAKAAAERGGYPRMALYVRGRGGALGEAPPAVVAAAFGVLAPLQVQALWEAGRAVASAEDAAAAFAGAAAEWGRRRLGGVAAEVPAGAPAGDRPPGGVAGAERLARLTSRVVTAADATGLPLFAGWRAVVTARVPDLGDDPLAAATLLLHALRELRGGLHLAALKVHALTPLAAVLLDPEGGAERAAFFGWPAEDIAATEAGLDRFSDEGAWRRADALTDRLLAPALTVLDDDEAADLLRLARAAVALLDAPPP